MITSELTPPERPFLAGDIVLHGTGMDGQPKRWRVKRYLQRIEDPAYNSELDAETAEFLQEWVTTPTNNETDKMSNRKHATLSAHLVAARDLRDGHPNRSTIYARQGSAWAGWYCEGYEAAEKAKADGALQTHIVRLTRELVALAEAELGRRPQ